MVTPLKAGSGLSGRLVLLWNTVRWLRPVQVYSRVWFRLARPSLDLRAAPPCRNSARRWFAPARQVSMVGERSFRFLGVERELSAQEDWNRKEWPKLWVYNAHYFDDLVATGAAEREEWHRRLILRWIDENPPGSGNGWEPYPLSLRIVNWIKWSLCGRRLDGVVAHSLAVQVRFLSQRLEFHLLGNHLWANLKAMIFASVYFSGEEADGWRNRAAELFSRELKEQVLPDGGHFERSAMYHSIVLEDLLDLIQLDACFPGVLPEAEVSAWRNAAVRMLRWLKVMCHPDGKIPFFNDAAFDIAVDLNALEGYARQAGVHVDGVAIKDVEVLDDSGFVCLRCADAVFIADVGNVGPSYIPGHAHAESLAFELSVRGRRVLVNGGTSTYEAGPERLKQRGTGMHNTMVVDGVDSSEVWGSFRVARRAKVHDLLVSERSGSIIVSAWHDGYRRLPGRVGHLRTWRLKPGMLVVEDLVRGRFQTASAFYRFCPELDVSEQGTVRSRDGLLQLEWIVEEASPAVAAGTWHPGFGVDQPCQVLELQPLRDRAKLTLLWNQSP
jgi:uncharacterized heparinase superfamily protein